MDALVNFLRADPNAANAFGALASAVAAFLALFVSAISVWISIWSARTQRKHNELSLRPLAEVLVADFENSLRVKLQNNGTGPMIITAVTVSDGNDTKECLIDWMPLLPGGRAWNNFTHTLRHRTLQSGEVIVLLELTEHKDTQSFTSCRDLVRRALEPLTVKVEYTDIYDSVMHPCNKSLSWFGRRV